MTKHECAVIMAFTGVAMLKGNDLDVFYEYVAKILCRPVYSHEMAMLSEEIKEASRNDFVQLCRNASDGPKRGEWEYRHADDWMFCTACGADAEGDCGEPLETNYCPNCGARMDGGADNG